MKEDLAKLKEQLAPMLALSKAMLTDLASGNGTFWKEAVGELQSQYNEIVLWVLLYEDANLSQTHAALCETLRPHVDALKPLQSVLFYEVVRGHEAFAAKLSGNDALFSAGTKGCSVQRRTSATIVDAGEGVNMEIDAGFFSE